MMAFENLVRNQTIYPGRLFIERGDVFFDYLCVTSAGRACLGCMRAEFHGFAQGLGKQRRKHRYIKVGLLAQIFIGNVPYVVCKVVGKNSRNMEMTAHRAVNAVDVVGYSPSQGTQPVDNLGACALDKKGIWLRSTSVVFENVCKG